MHSESRGAREDDDLKKPGGADRPRKTSRRWIRGRYLAAFEVSSFQPEGITERWWTSFDEHLARQARKLIDSARGTPVEVELAGDVSDPGEYGHMGLYNREFRVHAIRRKAK